MTKEVNGSGIPIRRREDRVVLNTVVSLSDVVKDAVATLVPRGTTGPLGVGEVLPGPKHVGNRRVDIATREESELGGVDEFVGNDIATQPDR